MCAFIGIAIGFAFGNSYPMFEGLFGMCLGVVVAVCLSYGTLFVRQTSSLRSATYILIGVAVFDLSTVPAIDLASKMMSPKVYDKESFRLDPLEKPVVNITGSWEGSWTDSKRKSSERFSMSLVQKDNNINGNSVFKDANETTADITGEVSGSKIRLVLMPHPTSPYGVIPDTTWLGSVIEGKISGEWYSHGKASSGYSTTGPWSAISTSAE